MLLDTQASHDGRIFPKRVNTRKWESLGANLETDYHTTELKDFTFKHQGASSVSFLLTYRSNWNFYSWIWSAIMLIFDISVVISSLLVNYLNTLNIEFLKWVHLFVWGGLIPMFLNVASSCGDLTIFLQLSNTLSCCFLQLIAMKALTPYY